MDNESTWKFIQEHAADDVCKLALLANKYPQVDMSFALQQISGRQKAKQKIPTFYANPLTQYPVSLSMEQCSSEITARYKATLVSGKSLADLTGGFGVDVFFMSDGFSEVDYIEKSNPVRIAAEYNFNLFQKKHINTICGDGVEFLQQMQHADCIYIDPARRDTKGKKMVSISDCDPDIIKLLPLFQEKADTVLIKLSPMLDINSGLEQLPHTHSIHVVSVDNECKEVLFLLKYNCEPTQPTITAVNINKNGTQKFCFTKQEEENALVSYALQPAKYLYEPNASVLKAGAFKSIAAKYGLQKLHTNTHLYTSDELHNDFCGRIFCINNTYNFSKQDIKNLQNNIHKANITTRNFPEAPETLRKKLKLSDGGDVYLFATTLSDGKKVIIQGQKV